MAEEDIETPEAPEPEETEVETPEAPEASTEDNFDGWTTERAVEELKRTRAEAARYRTRAKAFDGWEDEEALEAWSSLVSRAKEDPGGALADLVLDGYGMTREQLLEFADAIYQGETPEIPETPTGEDDDDLDRPMTRRELLEMEQAKENDRLTQQAIEAVRTEAKELGFNPEASPGSFELIRYRNLVQLAREAYGNDLKKAAAALNDFDNQQFEKVAERKRKEAENGPTVPDGGAGAEPAERPTGWGASRRSALERAAANGRPLPTP